MIKDHMISRMMTEPALNGLDEGDVLELLKVMEEVTLPQNKVLTWEETPVQEFGVVLNGALGVFWGANKKGVLGVGERFGVQELRGDKCWRHTLVTECDTRVLVSDKANLAVVTEANPRLATLLGVHAPVVVPAKSWRLRRPLRRRVGTLALG